MTHKEKMYILRLISELGIGKIPEVNHSTVVAELQYHSWSDGGAADDNFEKCRLYGEKRGRHQIASLLSKVFKLAPRTSWSAVIKNSGAQCLYFNNEAMFEELGFNEQTPPKDWPSRDPDEEVELPEKYI